MSLGESISNPLNDQILNVLPPELQAIVKNLPKNTAHPHTSSSKKESEKDDDKKNPFNLPFLKGLKATHLHLTPEQQTAADLVQASKLYTQGSDVAARDFLNANNHRNYSIDNTLSSNDFLVLQNTRNGDIEVAFRGTNPQDMNNLIADGKIFVGNDTYPEGTQLINRIRQTYGKLPTRVSGYSLGGNRANRVAQEFQIESVLFNPYFGVKGRQTQATAPQQIIRTTDDLTSLSLGWSPEDPLLEIRTIPTHPDVKSFDAIGAHRHETNFLNRLSPSDTQDAYDHGFNHDAMRSGVRASEMRVMQQFKKAISEKKTFTQAALESAAEGFGGRSFTDLTISKNFEKTVDPNTGKEVIKDISDLSKGQDPYFRDPEFGKTYTPEEFQQKFGMTFEEFMDDYMDVEREFARLVPERPDLRLVDDPRYDSPYTTIKAPKGDTLMNPKHPYTQLWWDAGGEFTTQEKHVMDKGLNPFDKNYFADLHSDAEINELDNRVFQRIYDAHNNPEYGLQPDERMNFANSDANAQEQMLQQEIQRSQNLAARANRMVGTQPPGEPLFAEGQRLPRGGTIPGLVLGTVASEGARNLLGRTGIADTLGREGSEAVVGATTLGLFDAASSRLTSGQINPRNVMKAGAAGALGAIGGDYSQRGIQAGLQGLGVNERVSKDIGQIGGAITGGSIAGAPGGLPGAFAGALVGGASAVGDVTGDLVTESLTEEGQQPSGGATLAGASTKGAIEGAGLAAGLLGPEAAPIGALAGITYENIAAIFHQMSQPGDFTQVADEAMRDAQELGGQPTAAPDSTQETLRESLFRMRP